MAKATTPKKAKKKGGFRPGAGRPAMPNGEARTERITFRVSPVELSSLERIAGGKSVGEFARDVALGCATPAKRQAEALGKYLAVKGVRA